MEVSDKAAERIADTAAAGAAVAISEVRKEAEETRAGLAELREVVRLQAETIGQMREDRSRIEDLLAQRNAPPDIRIDGDTVYYTRGTEVERKRVTRDESGRVVSIAAA